MKLGFIKPNYPNEKRVALLPVDIKNFENEIVIEKDFGEFLDISNDEYIKKGCTIKSREWIYQNCDAIFSLKIIQKNDYKYLRKNQIIIGWTHPYGGGLKFMEEQAYPKNLTIVDLDNITPRIFKQKRVIDIEDIPRNFIQKNSFNAGYASTIHAIISHGLMLDNTVKVAVLAAGNVSQGAFYAVSQLGAQVRLFYRKTMNEFKNSIGEYDIIINGIEVDTPNLHIINQEDLTRVKKYALIIDAAADAGNAIQNTVFSSIDKPIYKNNDIYYYVVNNSPSIIYRKSSEDISKSFSKYVYSKDISKYLNI